DLSRQPFDPIQTETAKNLKSTSNCASWVPELLDENGLALLGFGKDRDIVGLGQRMVHRKGDPGRAATAVHRPFHEGDPGREHGAGGAGDVRTGPHNRSDDSSMHSSPSGLALAHIFDQR